MQDKKYFFKDNFIFLTLLKNIRLLMYRLVSKIVLIMFYVPLTLYSQDVNMDKTIDYLNKKLKNICTIDTKKNEIKVLFYEHRRICREDIVNFQDIDTTKIFYDINSNSIILKCYGNNKCVFRKIYKSKTRRFYTRINILYDSDSVSVNGVVNAFVHLFKLAQDDNYKNNKAFE